MADPREDFTRWILISGDRRIVAGLFTVLYFVALVSLGLAGVIDLENRAAVRGIAGGFVPGLIAFLSIVLAINQLVLSQELGSAGEIRDRIQRVREYRRDVEEVAEAGPSPVLPTGFLSFVVRTIETNAIALEESVDAQSEPHTCEAVEEYARTVSDEARDARRSLDRVRPGRINALLPVLEYSDSRQLWEARRLRRELRNELPRETRRRLSEVTEALELFGVARTQFRTTYTQRVLARLSRQLLYVGLPALLAVMVLGLVEPASTPYLSGTGTVIFVSALFSVALSPLTVLSAYLLRVASISERTIAVGPFVSRPRAVETNGNSDSDGEVVTDRAPTDHREEHR